MNDKRRLSACRAVHHLLMQLVAAADKLAAREPLIGAAKKATKLITLRESTAYTAR